jgi:hypothetical protein
MRRPPPCAWLLVLLLAGWAGSASAITVRYVATDLPEAPSAPDRWRYDYTVDAFPYAAGWGFTVYFDPLLYGAIETPLPAVGAGWDAVAFQPDPGSFDGIYDVEATISSPSVATTFSVVFTWLGAGEPGAQPFELRDPIYVPAQLGLTVPEPQGAAAAAAVLAAFAAIAARRRRAAARRGPPLAVLGGLALLLSACGDEWSSALSASGEAGSERAAPARVKPDVAGYHARRTALAARHAEQQALARAAASEPPPGAGAPAPGASPAALADAVPLAAEVAHPSAVEQLADAGGAGGGISTAVHSRLVGNATVRFWLTRVDRTGRGRHEYTFAVSVQNRGAGILSGAVLVSSGVPASRVVDSCAPFGVTPAGLTRAADDPFVIAQDRAVAFDPARLSFTLAPMADPALCADPGRVTLRRLTRSEYDNTVRDLLGTTQRPGRDFPADDYGYGFDNIGDVLSLSPLLLEKAELAAAKVVEDALRVYPESPIATRYEAEAGQAECGGGPYNGFWNLWSSCGITHQVPVDLPGRYELRVRAYEQHAGNDYARMQLRVNGSAAGPELLVSATSSAPAIYTREVTLQPGIHAVKVEFTNDYYEPPADRNLHVDWIELRGPLDAPPPSAQVQALRALCTPATHGVASCHRQMLAAFARRAWRRPLAAGELEWLARLADDAVAAGAGFDEALGVAMRAALVSPHFLFKVERDPHPNSAEKHWLSDHELATRLSYLVWASLPDDALLAAADAGQLRQPGWIAAHVERMILDPRIAGFVNGFGGQWLGTRGLEDVNPDYAFFPSWDADLQQSMAAETLLFFLSFVQNPRSFLDFFDADYSFVNDRLAQHYGLPPPGSATPVHYPLSPSVQRGGIFTHGSVLTVTSQPRRTSPVKRGKWALDQLLCIDIPPPPAGVEGMLDQPGGPTGTLRERLAQHRANPECAACHDYLDPIGLGLENFDAIGAWRTHDAGEVVDASGRFPDGRSFSGPRQMAALVKADPSTPRCIAERLLVYALGRGLGPRDAVHLDAITAQWAAGGYEFRRLLVAVAQSEPFRMRRGEPGGAP